MSPRGIEIKTAEQITRMRKAGLVVAEALAAMGDAVRVGATTRQLDQVATDVLASHGARSSFLNYGAEWGYPPYPATVCASVNQVIVHGIPNDEPFVAGDIVSIDFGAIVDGWHGDAARTFVVGEPAPEVADLVEITRQAMWDGVAAAATGSRVGDISHAIQRRAEQASRRIGIVREYTGHGIGTAMHQPPDVPNFGRARRGPRLSSGLCLAIEPIFTLGGANSLTLDDEWTVITADGSTACHWENTVAICDDGIWVLTEPDGGRAELAARGITVSKLAD